MSAITCFFRKDIFAKCFLILLASTVWLATGAGLTAQALPTTLTLSTHSPINELGINVTATATLRPDSVPGRSADGKPVVFLVSAGGAAKPTQYTAPLRGGAASLSILASQPLKVSASFAGTPDLSASASLNTLYFGVGQTTATLVATSKNGPADTVPSGTVVTLTASVQTSRPAGAPVTYGQVNFCNAEAPYCTDINLIGSAQLTPAGTASIKLIPGIDSHKYKAIFLGTNSNPRDVSNTVEVDVTGLHTTSATIASSGTPGNYALKGTVTTTVGAASPTGPVYFLDFSNGNSKLASVPLGAATESLGSMARTRLSLGRDPIRIKLADVNGDGIPDGVGVDIFEWWFDLLLGRGDGTFTHTIFPTDLYPTDLVVGDFNRDGKPDVAVANSIPRIFTPGSVSVFLGTGDGNFNLQSSPTVGLEPTAIATADFNGDGILDLATANYSDATATILLGNGDGTFTATPSPVALAPNLSRMVSGDFNGDGKADLVVSISPDSLIVLLGKGDGTFSTRTEIPAEVAGIADMVVGEFNGDGKQDLAVASNSTNTIAVLFGDGTGNFSTDASYPTVPGPGSLAIGDFNHDGEADFVVIGGAESTMLLGKRDGTFAQTPVMTTALGHIDIAAGDLNGDGVSDFLTEDAGGGTTFQGCSATGYLTQLTHMATVTASSVSVPGTGTHLVGARYPGDANYRGTQSATIPLTATPVKP